MDAKEANKIANGFNNSLTNKEFVNIIEKIKLSANVGNFYLYHYESISLNVFETLEKLGYQVKNLSDQREGECFFISWQ